MQLSLLVQRCSGAVREGQSVLSRHLGRQWRRVDGCSECYQLWMAQIPSNWSWRSGMLDVETVVVVRSKQKLRARCQQGHAKCLDALKFKLRSDHDPTSSRIFRAHSESSFSSATLCDLCYLSMTSFCSVSLESLLRFLQVILVAPLEDLLLGGKATS